MKWSREFMREKMLTDDVAWDGKFVVCVISTGIYCLPSCRARVPKFVNTVFVENEEAAIESGFRACKRCKPDHYYLGIDCCFDDLKAVTQKVSQEPGNYETVEDVAIELGVGITKLHEMIRRYYHLTPSSYLKKWRLLFVRKRLEISDQKISDFAFEAGYQSMSVFYSHFKSVFGMSPNRYRDIKNQTQFICEMPQPYDLKSVMDYLGRDPGSVSISREGHSFVLPLKIKDEAMTIVLTFNKDEVTCKYAGRLDIKMGWAIHAWLINMLGLWQDPKAFEKTFPILTDQRNGLRIPQIHSLFEGLIWVISGQQVNLKFTYTMLRNLCVSYGDQHDNGLYFLPGPEVVETISMEAFREMQFSKQKAMALIRAAKAVQNSNFQIDSLSSFQEINKMLQSIKGIGPWSSQYLLMRHFGFMDSFPVRDAGLLRGLKKYFDLDKKPDANQENELMSEFSPHRGLAAFHLWHI